MFKGGDIVRRKEGTLDTMGWSAFMRGLDQSAAVQIIKYSSPNYVYVRNSEGKVGNFAANKFELISSSERAPSSERKTRSAEIKLYV